MNRFVAIRLASVLSETSYHISEIFTSAKIISEEFPEIAFYR